MGYDVREAPCEEADEREFDEDSSVEVTDEQLINMKVERFKSRLNTCLETKRRANLTKIAQQKFIDENKELIDECEKQGVSLPFDLRFIHPDIEEELVESSCSSTWAEKYTWLTEEEIESMKQQVFKYQEREKEIINEHFSHCVDGKYPVGQLNALIDEYAHIEKLKLVLVDRIRGNLMKRDIRLSHEQFSSINERR